MKKLLVIGGVVVAIFVLIVVLTNKSNEAKLKDNPYDTDNLRSSTIDLIGNEHYSNIILPADLEKKVASGDGVFAYFFSPECGYCKEMTPVLMPIAKDMGVQVDQFNLLEYEEQAPLYGITSTPTLVYYENGEEIARMEGAPPQKEVREKYIRDFFTEFNTK